MSTTTLKRTIPHEVEITLDGMTIADLFWELDEKGQAEFFNRLAEKALLTMQLQAVTTSGTLSPAGRRVMALIGEYSEPTKP